MARELETQPEDREPVFSVFFPDGDSSASVTEALISTLGIDGADVRSAWRHYLADVPDSETGWELVTRAVVAAGFDVYNGTEWWEAYR
jgi:hypothetical protein